MMYQTPPATEAPKLEDYLKAIASRWPLVLAVALLLAAVGYWFGDSREDTYSTTATVAMGPSPVGSTNANLAAPRAERESQVLVSNRLAEAVIDRLDLDTEPGPLLQLLDVKFIPNSEVLSLEVVGPDADETAAIANAFVEEYVDQRESDAEGLFNDKITVLEEQKASVVAEVVDANARIETLQRERSDLLQTVASDERTSRQLEIDAELAAVRANLAQTFVQQRLIQTDLDDANLDLESRQETASVLRTADVPTVPLGIPTMLITVALGLLGLALGTALAFVLDRLDSTARDEKRLSLALGTTVLGEIPSFGISNRGGQAGVVMLSTSGGHRVQRSKEAFRRLRSAILFLKSGDEDSALAVMFTSAHPAEGKSTVVANTAIALAQAGQRVVVISADMRRPTIGGYFGVTAESGLSNFLGLSVDQVPLEETDIPNLWLIPAGPAPSNPGELLGSSRFEQLVESARSDVDFVLIDTPPVLSTADALAIAPLTDGVLVVVDSRRTTTDDLLQVRSELERTGSTLMGGVLNRDRKRRSGSFLRRDRYAYSKAAAK